MSITQYEIHKCDNCGKEEKTQYSRSIRGWFGVEVKKWTDTNSASILINKELCSEKCVLEFLRKLKKIPKPKPQVFHI